MNTNKLSDSTVLAETLQDNIETIDIYLMALATLIQRTKDSDEDNKLRHITNRMETLHDLLLDKTEDLDILQNSIVFRTETDTRK